MQKFYLHLGRRRPLPSTRQILNELGQRKLDPVTKHSQTGSRGPIFPTDIYGRKLAGNIV
jgi:hypothetical protein